MLKIDKLKELKSAARLIDENRDEINQFVIAALKQFTLKKSSEMTGLDVSKLSRSLSSGKGFAGDDLITCFLALTKNL